MGSGILLHNGGAVCYENNHFDGKAANAICKTLGFSHAAEWTNVVMERDIPFASLTKLKCLDDAWSSCIYSKGSICTTSQAIAITCKGETSLIG